MKNAVTGSPQRYSDNGRTGGREGEKHLVATPQTSPSFCLPKTSTSCDYLHPRNLLALPSHSNFSQAY